MKLRDILNSPIVRVVTFCILFNSYTNSHNTTKLNYMATSVTLMLLEVKYPMSADLTILTATQ